ncbi:MAG: 4-alpha-glucanotransferase [Eubacteriales bacterium]|nr:4-alpha-glucanotransferase [Eubacteriales bacterium]
MKRASGVLLPVFSLPSRFGIGSFSKEAYEFVDYLKNAGQTYWQILPLGPTSYGDSPYQSFSTFAGNPYFIDPEELIRQGLLTEEECSAVDFGTDPKNVDYEKMYNGRYTLLLTAFHRSGIAEKKEFSDWCRENAFWLDDYSLFMAVKSSQNGVSYMEWPEDIRKHEADAVEKYAEELQEQIFFYKYLQYEFSCQWMKLKAYANAQGIRIIGDIPIYVSADSADIWANPGLFQLDEEGRPSAVAGCPPDGFAADGQLWGNPLYDWTANKETGYAWWISRIAACRQKYDVIRIDHFRGFDEYFSIKAGEPTARDGHWEKGPGMDLFLAIREALGEIDIIAEDLGYITDSVRQLVRDSGFPNMKVLEFAFDSRDSSGAAEYLPYNFNKNCVVYTGTHDNETLLQWLDSILPEERRMVEAYLGYSYDTKEELVDALVRLAHASTADLCIIPMQDYLCLGAEARINQPSITGCNWKWRLVPEQLNEAVQEKIRINTKIFGR